ncbi:MAG TPA: ArsC/Spx/MgsR family protein [Gaiellales bacterium]|jgi:arsenate reductase
MADVTIYHNPHCHASVNAITIADELGVDYEVVLYMRQRPDRATLEGIADRLEDPVADLVRKDSVFKKLGLDEADFAERDAVVDLLVQRPALLQRPVVVRGERAIVGRPKERIRELLA